MLIFHNFFNENEKMTERKRFFSTHNDNDTNAAIFIWHIADIDNDGL